MIVNLVLIFIIIIAGIIFGQLNGANKDCYAVRKKYILFISVLLILQSGLRNVAVGEDTYTYYLDFNDIYNRSWDDIYQNFYTVYQFGEGKDPGYPLFEKMVATVFNDYQFFLFVIAILFFTAFGNFLLKNTRKLNDAVIAFIIYSVLFYGFFSITVHRQTIATAASLFAFEWIKKKKLVPFLLLIIAAATIHKSVLLFIPFYFIATLKNAKYFNWIILLLFPILMIYKEGVSTFFKSLAGYDNYGIYEGAGTYTFTALFLIITIVALIRSKIILKDNPQAIFAFNAFTIALLFIPLTWVNPSAMRVVQYFSIFMLILIPEIVNSYHTYAGNLQRYISTVLIVILIGLFIKSSWDAMPYGFFWEDMELSKNYNVIRRE